LNAKYTRAKAILQEEIDEAQRKLDARKRMHHPASSASEEHQDIILKGIQAAQQRLRELKACDPALDEESQDSVGDNTLMAIVNYENDGQQNNIKRKKKRKSLIERQVEMKEQIQAVSSFLHTLQSL
jgi:hypothetical protein